MILILTDNLSIVSYSLELMALYGDNQPENIIVLQILKYLLEEMRKNFEKPSDLLNNYEIE